MPLIPKDTDKSAAFEPRVKTSRPRAIRRLVIWYRRNAAVTTIVDTAANSANLVNLINQTQDSFNKIMNMQLPNIVPFENKELEIKFLEISDQLVQSTES